MSGIPWRFDPLPDHFARIFAWVETLHYLGAFVVYRWDDNQFCVPELLDKVIDAKHIKAWCPIDKPEVTPDE